MGEIGQKYNKEITSIDYDRVEYLKECFELIYQNKNDIFVNL